MILKYLNPKKTRKEIKFITNDHESNLSLILLEEMETGTPLYPTFTCIFCKCW